MTEATEIVCSRHLDITAVEGLGVVEPGDELPKLLGDAAARSGFELHDGDILCVASKVVSRAENQLVDLATVEPSPRARNLAATTEKDARLVELILRESRSVSRAAPGVLVTRHRSGLVSANAAIDSSNVLPPPGAPGTGPWVLLLPRAPDESASSIREHFQERFRRRVGVIVTDSLGRPFRRGTVGVAVGIAGLPPTWDRRGERDLGGRPLEHTETAFADQVAATADLVAGQAAEGRALVVVRGLDFPDSKLRAAALYREEAEDLYA